MTANDVLTGADLWSVEQGDAISWLDGLPAGALDLMFCSPPYEKARLYLEGGQNLGIARKTEEWVAWLVNVTKAALRACKGLVALVVEGQTKDFRYSCGPALLMADLHRAGVCLRKPPIFARKGAPGSGGPDWLANDWEWIICATNGGRLPWSDNTAYGKPPKYKPGGAMSNRMADGTRVNAKPRRVVRGRANGDTVTSDSYLPPALANPGNILRYKVGGGRMGHPLAHENEAPFPLGLAEFFVQSFCPPALCSGCGFALQGRYANTTMPAVRRPIPSVQIPRRPEQILLQSVRESGHDEAATAVQVVQRSDTNGEGNGEQHVLLEEMLKPLDIASPENDAVSASDAKWLHLHSHAVPPVGITEGICDGASACDGEESGQAANQSGGRPSQKWQKGRQPAGKPGVDDQASPRLFAQAKEPNRLPEVFARHSQDALCPSCGADLSLPGAVKPPGIVCDPFSGSGTTLHASIINGRRFVGADLRQSQVDLAIRRAATITPNMF